MRTLVTLFISLFVIQATSAQSYYCDRPRKPYISFYGVDFATMQSAQYDVDRYLKKMKEYVDCLANEQNDAVDENNRLLRDWNIAVDQFNNQ